MTVPVRFGSLCPACFHPGSSRSPFGHCTACGCRDHGIAPVPTRARTKRSDLPLLRARGWAHGRSRLSPSRRDRPIPLDTLIAWSVIVVFSVLFVIVAYLGGTLR